MDKKLFTMTKKGKHRTNNINIVILPVIVLIILFISAYTPDIPVKEKWVIVIDPGHGGRDPGATGSFSYEKNVVLPVALKMGEYLEQGINNVKVIYTRKSDIYVDLNERAEIANRNKADLFISIHANLIQGRNAYGAETYVMGHTKDDQNLEVAMKENAVITLDKNYSTNYEGFDPNSPESYIMFTLMQNAFAEQSTDLAARMQNEYKNRIKRYDRGVKQAPFWVLWKTTMPSVLTEIGFISHVNEEKYLNSKAGQDSLAVALFRACRDYVADIERKSSVSTVKPAEPAAVVPSETDPDITGKTFFMVQIATSSKKIEIKPGSFKNLGEITEIITGNRYRYATGKFEDYSKAVAYRKEVERIYADAFVIAVKNNKILPLQEALDSNKSKSK